MSKANLYKLSNPGKFPAVKAGNFSMFKNFKVHIGTWEKTRTLSIRATSLAEAVSKGWNLCKGDEHVIEVFYEQNKVWDYFQEL